MKCVVYSAAITMAALVSSACVAQDVDKYHLGVQDRLRVHVHEWPALTGEFVIGANGTLALPLVGIIQAKGLDAAGLASQIGNRLREKVGLSAAPDTTVEIAQYRPFYILGGVERPGEYHYRPGMLVVNAVAIAGGIYRPPRTSDWSFERDSITGRGDIKLAAVRRDELKAREFRLKAEADGLSSFPAVPADLPSGVGKFIEDETRLFGARFDRFKNQSVSIDNSITLHENEIKSLQDQISSARKQEESVAKELEDTRGLVARSVIPAPRILPIERTLAQIEREKKEIETSILRARQQINTLKSQKETLKDERRSNALAELQSLETQLKELDARVETASRLIAGSNAMLSTPQETGDAPVSASFMIIRQRDGKVLELDAVETTLLHPGDIVKVIRQHDVGLARQSSAVPAN